MYLGVDIGGTKTLVAVLADNGVITEESRYDTPEKYEAFLVELKKSLDKFDTKEFEAAAAGVPAMTIDRVQGVASNFSNLPFWPKVNIAEDIEELARCPVLVENDTKLAGLSEAMLVKHEFSRVLYITISTGIGFSFINDLVIDTNAGDAGGKTYMLERAGKIVDWESFASGKSIAARFKKMAQEINDEETWRIISKDILMGLVQLIAVFQPSVVIVGGSVGKYFNRYDKILKEELKKYELPIFQSPVIIGAERPDNAVVYGCYDLARTMLHHG